MNRKDERYSSSKNNLFFDIIQLYFTQIYFN